MAENRAQCFHLGSTQQAHLEHRRALDDATARQVQQPKGLCDTKKPSFPDGQVDDGIPSIDTKTARISGETVVEDETVH